jgi:hypothetical protein
MKKKEETGYATHFTISAIGSIATSSLWADLHAWSQYF